MYLHLGIKKHMERNNGGLEDDFHLQMGNFEVPAVNFQGGMSYGRQNLDVERMYIFFQFEQGNLHLSCQFCCGTSGRNIFSPGHPW